MPTMYIPTQMMSTELIAVILLLVALLVFQQFFWSRVVYRLLDRLMSRNYQDFKTVENPAPAPSREGLPTDIPEDLRALQGIHL